MSGNWPGLSRPAEVIPVPTTISPAAQAFLAHATRRIADLEASQEAGDQTAAAERALQMLRSRAAEFRGACETIDLGTGASLYRVTPEARTGRRAEVAYVDIHGGGFVAGGGEMCRVLAHLRAMEHGVEVWAIDYRLAPAHAWPAALDDCMTAYRIVLKHHNAGDIVIAGSSAGGNLAAALLLRAHSEGLPMPAALLLLTPGLDLTGAGDTRQTNRYLDVNLYGGAEDGPAAYLGDADPRDPFVSPIYGSSHDEDVGQGLMS